MFWKICKSFKLMYYITFTIIYLVTLSKCQHEKPNSDVSESWGSSDIKIAKLRYTYILNHFKYCCESANDNIMSPIFSIDGECKWRLNIFRQEGTTENEDYLALFLESVDCQVKASVKFSILNAEGKKSFIQEFFNGYKPSEAFGFAEFLSRKDLFNITNGLLPDEKLTIICEIAVLSDRENNAVKLPFPMRHLIEDLAFLLDNQDLSDVTLTVADGRTFKAHKAILAVRSSVFKTMFVNDAVNVTIGSVEIPDLDYKVLQEMLRYIYTDEVLELEKIAPKLLIAANTYKLDGLKIMSENNLRSKLSIENAVDYFVLGDKYGAMDLKMDAKYFINTHRLNIRNTTGLQNLILSQPRLALEIF